MTKIYTPGVYLHRGVYCACERGFRRSYGKATRVNAPLGLAKT